MKLKERESRYGSVQDSKRVSKTTLLGILADQGKEGKRQEGGKFKVNL